MHIADVTAEVLVKKGIKTVGLLGTVFTMEQEFCKDRLIMQYKLDDLVPDKTDRQVIHKVSYEELCLGEVKQNSKSEYLRIIDLLANRGAEAVIWGCTEIGMLVIQGDTDVELINTTEIHARKVVEYAI